MADTKFKGFKQLIKTKRLELKPMPATFEMTHTLYELIDRNRKHFKYLPIANMGCKKMKYVKDGAEMQPPRIKYIVISQKQCVAAFIKTVACRIPRAGMPNTPTPTWTRQKNISHTCARK